MRLRLRFILRRFPFAYWLVAVSVAAAAGLTVSALVGQASARAARLGGLVDVAVAARAVGAGETLAPGDVALRRLPAAALPDGPLARAPVGRPALVPLARGEVLLAAKLAPDGVGGVAALVPRGRRAVAVPVAPGGLAVRRGDRVDVLATFETAGVAGGEDSAGEDAGGGDAGGGGEDGAPTFAVATAAVVVDVAEESVTVAVTPHEASRVAFAIARGVVTLALTAFTGE